MVERRGNDELWRALQRELLLLMLGRLLAARAGETAAAEALQTMAWILSPEHSTSAAYQTKTIALWGNGN